MTNPTTHTAHDSQTAATRRRWQFTLRDLILITTVVAVYVVAVAAIIRNYDRQDLAGFTIAVFVGTVPVLLLIPRWSSRRAGPTLVLLRYRMSRMAFFAWACWAPLLVVFAVPWLKVAHTTAVEMLLMFWMVQSLCFALNSFFRQSCALCERGCIRDGIYFVSWRRIRKFDWRIDGDGNLVSNVLGKRVMAIIPPDARSKVDALLREKLAE